MMTFREIAWRMKKPARTLQSYFPFLKDAKDGFYRSYRRTLRIPSEPFFAAVRKLDAVFQGSYVDVGGNTGQSIESILLYAPNARVISFEANPGLAARLADRYRSKPNVTVRPIGLGRTAGHMRLYVPSYRGFVYDGLGSLYFENASSWLSPDTLYFFDSSKLQVQSFDCAIETLDMQNLADPIFIKIDVEGGEYDVLTGGIETLRRSRPILSIEGLREKPELEQFVRTMGYAPYEFDRGKFIPGYAAGNTFLITPERMSAIDA